MNNQLTDIYTPPHDIKSRDVREEDVKRVLVASQIMAGLCRSKMGGYESGLALAHSQITEEDPLRFFVTVAGDIIINPIITRQTKVGVHKMEGCLTYYLDPPKMVSRSYKIEVSYRTITDKEELSEVIHKKVKGLQAQVFQHEIGHMEGKYIYDKSKYDKRYTDYKSAQKAIESSKKDADNKKSRVRKDSENDGKQLGS